MLLLDLDLVIKIHDIGWILSYCSYYRLNLTMKIVNNKKILEVIVRYLILVKVLN